MTFSEHVNSTLESDDISVPFPRNVDQASSSAGTLSLVDLAYHKTMEETLPFTVEWAGTNYRIFVPRSVLEDLDHATSYREDEQMVTSFKRNKELILKRTLAALEDGRGRWCTVLLKQSDFPESYQ